MRRCTDYCRTVPVEAMTNDNCGSTGKPNPGEGTMKDVNKTYRCFCSNRFCRYYGQPINSTTCRCNMRAWMDHYLTGVKP